MQKLLRRYGTGETTTALEPAIRFGRINRFNRWWINRVVYKVHDNAADYVIVGILRGNHIHPVHVQETVNADQYYNVKLEGYFGAGEEIVIAAVSTSAGDKVEAWITGFWE